jgi:hypothetical protein
MLMRAAIDGTIRNALHMSARMVALACAMLNLFFRFLGTSAAAAVMMASGTIVLTGLVIDLIVDVACWLIRVPWLVHIINRSRVWILRGFLLTVALKLLRNIAGFEAGCVCVLPRECVPCESAQMLEGTSSVRLVLLAWNAAWLLGEIVFELIGRVLWAIRGLNAAGWFLGLSLSAAAWAWL